MASKLFKFKETDFFAEQKLNKIMVLSELKCGKSPDLFFQLCCYGCHLYFIKGFSG
jgi:hypothetical protein